MPIPFLSTAIENSTGVIAFSLDRHYCYTSFTGSHFLTMKKIWNVEIAIGVNLLDLLEKLNRGDYLKAKENFDRALAGEHFTKIEDYGDENQRLFWEDRYDPILDEHKTIVGLVVFVIDVTERIALVETNNISTERLNLAVSAATIGIWEWNMITNEIFWSDEILTIYGLDESFRTLTFEDYLTYVHPEDIGILKRDIDTCLQTNGQYKTEHRVIPPDGITRWITGTGKVFLKNGVPTKMIGTVIDITQQKADANALLKSQEIYRTLTNNMHDMVAQADSQGKFIYLSPSYRTVLGFEDPSALVGQSIFDRVHPDDIGWVLDRFTVSLEKKISESAEFRYKNAKGDYVWIETLGNPILDSNGEVKTLVLSSRDVSEKKANEAALQHRDEMLSALADATSQLAVEPDLWIGLWKAVQILGEKTGADRVLIFQNETNSTAPAFTLKIKWTAPALTSKFEYDGTEQFAFALAPSLERTLSANRVFVKHVTDIEDIAYQNELVALHVKSIINLPIKVNGKFWGFIGVDECKVERNITDSEYAILKSFVATVSAALERKEIERENKDWQTRYEIIAASSGQVIYDYDVPSGQIVWSGNSKDVLGLEINEMGNVKEWEKRIHAEDRERITADLEACRLEGSSFQVEYRFQTKSSGYTQLFDRGFFLKDAEGVAYRMLGIMTDISQQKKAEFELKESENRFRTLQEASFGGIGLHYQGEILDANKGLSDITGFSYDELIGMNGVNLVAPESQAVVKEKITMGYDKPYDVIGIRKDGTRYNLEIHGKNIPYQGKTIRVTEFRDITERKQNEEKILEQNNKLSLFTEDLKRKNEQLEEFTQIVSHNLRSPVSNILSLLDFYEKTEDADEKKMFIKMLHDSGSKILTSLQELNEVLKIKQDKDIARQDLQFENVLDGVRKQLSSQIAEAKAVLSTDFERAPKVSYPNIYLESILMNLLSNALKYRHPGRTPEISLKSTVENERVVLIVTDNGLGIDLKRYGHHIFKLRKTFHKHPESRGIGLFMIKSQIEALGGEISISSEPNIGTTFIVTL
jgi:PAS domain S-box-containing protein